MKVKQEKGEPEKGIWLQEKDSGKTGWHGGEVMRHRESQGEGQEEDQVHREAEGPRATAGPRQCKDQSPVGRAERRENKASLAERKRIRFNG